MNTKSVYEMPLINFKTYNSESYPSPRESPHKYSKMHKFIHKKQLNLYHPPHIQLNGMKTLVLDLDETLIHSSKYLPHPSVKAFIIKDNSIQIDDDNLDSIGENESESDKYKPLYVYMRPGLEEFISFAKENFEVFVYTHAEREYAETILDYIWPDLDENHRLYRDSCLMATKTSSSSYYSSTLKAYKKADLISGNKKFKISKMKSKGIIKDLVMLDRDFTNLIFVDDNDYQAYAFNNCNTIVIPAWNGVPNDNILLNWLKPILINCIKVKDVRDIISNVTNRRHRFTL